MVTHNPLVRYPIACYIMFESCYMQRKTIVSPPQFQPPSFPQPKNPIWSPLPTAVMRTIITSPLFQTPHSSQPRTSLRLSTDALSELDVFWHDSHPFSMKGAQVCVLKQPNMISFSCLLQCKNR